MYKCMHSFYRHLHIFALLIPSPISFSNQNAAVNFMPYSKCGLKYKSLIIQYVLNGTSVVQQLCISILFTLYCAVQMQYVQIIYICISRIYIYMYITGDARKRKT